MKRERDLRRRMHSLSTLADAIAAMKSLSAHHFSLARQALPAARQYRQAINRIVTEVGVSQPMNPVAPTGLLLVTSDLGLCGDYHTRLAEAALGERGQSVGPFYCIGRHARAALAHAAISPQRIYPAPTSADGLPRVLLGLAQDLLEDYRRCKIGRLIVLSARFDGVGHFTPVSTRLLPIEPIKPAARYRRSSYVSSDYLTAVVVREFMYTTLYELLLDALAAEHGMRLVMAHSAEQWLDETHHSLRTQWIAARREATTQEVLDIVAGARRRDWA